MNPTTRATVVDEIATPYMVNGIKLSAIMIEIMVDFLCVKPLSTMVVREPVSIVAKI